MALTRDQIDDLAEDGVFLGNVYEIARAIEAEVRKQDDELILQLVEALDDGEEHTAQCKNHWYAGCDCNKTAALTAARSRAKEGGA